MFNERAFIDQLESANVQELADLLLHPSSEQEQALRSYFGAQRFRSLRDMALRRSMRHSVSKTNLRGNVVVLPGVMGSELMALDRSGTPERLWMSLTNLMRGQIERLRLSSDGLSGDDPRFDVHDTGIMKRYYGELLLSLAKEWNVRAFWYDWRKDLKVAAAELEARIKGWFADDQPVHLVAHSLGGLVARTLIQQYPERWQAGGRLIMLGTPNHGTLPLIQVITGVSDAIDKLALLDPQHSREQITAIINSFVATYQMLPSPLKLPHMEPLYRASFYHDDLEVIPQRLRNARDHHTLLANVVDPDRMIYIAGSNQPTFVDADIDALEGSFDLSHYQVGLEGDGNVAHVLGELSCGDRRVPMYYVEDQHARLPSNSQILGALDELLVTGTTSKLSPTPIVSKLRGGPEQLREQLRQRQQHNTSVLETFIRRTRARGAQPIERPFVTDEERQAEEVMVRGFLSSHDDSSPRAINLPFSPTHITINVVLGDISRIDNLELPDQPPIDAIAIGHYIGVKPQGALRAIDEAISRVLPGMEHHQGSLADSDMLLSQYIERGTIRSDLGMPFFLADPRPSGQAQSRQIVIAGMGVPGRFGEPELVVLVRELCWALGRSGRRHMASVLTGAGHSNMTVPEAVDAWLRGIKRAITGAVESQQRHLKTITFVEHNPRRVIEINDSLIQVQKRLDQEQRLFVFYDPLSDERRADLERQYELFMQRLQRIQQPREPNPTRMTISMYRSVYRFGAITQDAAIPEREIALDPRLVNAANDELAAEWDLERQLERGQFLERLLIPHDLRDQLYTSAPLVLMLDSTTARIHWELIAQSYTRGSSEDDPLAAFLGTGRGVTRQLRTTFAPPPEPPPPPQRLLRVLVIADPAEDAHLPGAEEEGIAVADLFEQFNIVHAATKNRVEVIRLFGPREATRTTVLRHLMLRSYDIVHFAGHCIYDLQDRLASGWLFSHDERLTANELQRLDRVPKFVFSNACESGVTPDRAGLRTVDLAPSFAEAFFLRGVTNFVCTAWPVDDVAARSFALHLYAGLLGIDGLESGQYAPIQPKQMYAAMRQARRAITAAPYDTRTWGAYQHYGNPSFRFFEPTPAFEPGLLASGAASGVGPSRADEGQPSSDGGTAPPAGDSAAPLPVPPPAEEVAPRPRTKRARVQR